MTVLCTSELHSHMLCDIMVVDICCTRSLVITEFVVMNVSSNQVVFPLLVTTQCALALMVACAQAGVQLLVWWHNSIEMTNVHALRLISRTGKRVRQCLLQSVTIGDM